MDNLEEIQNIESTLEMTPPIIESLPIVVGIGASAGGLEAMKEFFKALPVNTGMAFVVVQHLEPNHESRTVEILAKSTAMPIIQAEDGMSIAPNTIYTNPAGRVLRIQKGRLVLDMSSKRQHVMKAIDDFLISLAEDRGENAIAIILSGSNGLDGPRGIQAIHAGGGMCIAQETATAQFPEMPQAAIDTGQIDCVLPAERMPEALMAFANLSPSPAMEGDTSLNTDMETIIGLLRKVSDKDYRHYKRSTLLRRIQRRMGIRQINDMGAYLELLRTDPNEVEQLGRDMLIGVSSFFRDAYAYEELQSVINASLKDTNKDPDEPFRAWVAGCSTGEEAYSIAILLSEACAEAGRRGSCQVFASDVDETALESARVGLYPDRIVADVSPERLERFFTRQGQFYQVKKELRELVVFSRQNLLNDPPFSKLDLISCRNVLIYLDSVAHKRLLTVFSFALKLGGHLFLGKSEGIGDLENYFETVTPRRNHIYRLVRANRFGGMPLNLGLTKRTPTKYERAQLDLSTLAQTNLEALLRHYNASQVLIDPTGKILFFHGRTELYLGHPKGLASLNILDLTEGALSTRLRRAIVQAQEQDEPITFSSMSLSREPSPSRDLSPVIQLTVRRLSDRNVEGKILSVVFEELQPPLPSATALDLPVENELLVSHLEAEIKALRLELHANAEAYDISSEELKAANEEIMSMNEELQSANEELEASKEELQSLNEELSTVNSQLYEKVNDLSDTNNDLFNLLNSTEIATVFLDSQLCIKRFTPTVTGLLNLIESDIGRPIGHTTLNFSGVDLAADVQSVLKNLTPLEKEVRTHKGQWFTLHIMPYRTQDNRIDGAVITFSDVTRLKQVEHNLQLQMTYAENIVETVRHPLIVLDDRMCILSANPAFGTMFQVETGQVEGQRLYDLLDPLETNPLLKEYLEQIIPTQSVLEDFRHPHTFPQTGRRILLISGRCIQPAGDRPKCILLSLEDVTERENAHRALEMLAGRRLEKIRELAIQMAQSEQHERERMAGMLHDNLQQLLVSAKFPLNKMRSHTQDEKLLILIKSVENLLDEMLNASRSLISDLSPTILYEAGLDAALPWLARKMESEHGLKVLTVINAKVKNDSEGVVILLFQAVRELLLNIVKHAGVDTAHIQLDQLDDDRVQIVVHDDGAGFDPDLAKGHKSDKSTGLGLFGLRERLQHIGAQCIIESRPGAGTHITLIAVVKPVLHNKRKTDFSEMINENQAIHHRELTEHDPGKIRVLLVDDHKMVREGLAGLLAQEEDIEIVGEAGDGDEAVEMAQLLQPDVVIMDVVMPGMNGVEATRIITAKIPTTRVIGLSMYVEADRAQAMLEAGASAYLTKGGPSEDLIAAVRQQCMAQ